MYCMYPLAMCRIANIRLADCKMTSLIALCCNHQLAIVKLSKCDELSIYRTTSYYSVLGIVHVHGVHVKSVVSQHCVVCVHVYVQFHTIKRMCVVCQRGCYCSVTLLG